MLQAGRYEEAERLLRQVQEMRERAAGPDHPLTMSVLFDLGSVHAAQGRYDEAEPLFEHYLEFMRSYHGPRHPDALQAARYVAGAIVQQADRYIEAARYSDAERLLLRALQLQEEASGSDHRGTMAVVSKLAGVYTMQERYFLAEPLLRRVLDFSRARFGADHVQTLRAELDLVGVLGRSGAQEDAAAVLAETLPRIIRLEGENSRNALIVSNNLGRLYLDLSRPDEARPLLRRAFEGLRDTEGPAAPATLQVQMSLADAYIASERFEEADAILQQVVEAATATGSTDYRLLASSLFRRTQLRLHADSAALRTAAVEPARQLIDLVRARRRAGYGDPFLAADSSREEGFRNDAFGLYAEALWAARNAEPAPNPSQTTRLGMEAFEALQAAKVMPASQAIIQTALRREAEEAGEGLGALVAERDRLNQARLRLVDQVSISLSHSQATGAQERAALNAELERLETRVAEIERTLRERFSPDFLQFLRPRPLLFAEAQAMLAPDEALLIVVQTEFGTQSMAVSRDDSVWARTAWNDLQIERAVQRLLWEVGASALVEEELQRAWEQDQPDGAAWGFDRSTAFGLYRQIVEPLERVLEGKRRVYVTAGGALAGLPFSMLVTEPPEGSDNDATALRQTAWLADRHAIVHLPSFRALALLREADDDNESGSVGFIGFGDPALRGAATTRGLSRGGELQTAQSVLTTTRSGEVLANVNALRNLSRLPGTRRELENMRRALGAPASSVRLATEATETAVRNADLIDVDILAFATHGLMAGEFGGVIEPGLVLTPPAQATAQDDGYLAAAEVANLRLDADWVILSACNTAAGESGLSALSRAFLHAGARSLLASHWPVDDTVAARITVRAIELEQAGLPRAEAFQQAMREIREDASHDSTESSWAHPFYWAPFVLIGDGA